MADLKSHLAREISRVINSRELSQTEVAAIVGEAPTQISRLMCGHLGDFSVPRLLRTLLRLGYDVEVLVRPTAKLRRGKLAMKRTGG